MSKRLRNARRHKPAAGGTAVTIGTDASEIRVSQSTVTVQGSGRGRAPSGLEQWIAVCILCAVFFWANWDGLKTLVATWEREPDYTYGYLVAPIALLFLWFRRARFPGIQQVPGWGGFVLIALSVLLTGAGKKYFLNPLVGWSIIVWIGGTVWVLAGRRAFWWALPTIAFLVFMIPLPYRMEGALSWPLQRVAANLSCWTLQLLGQPAIAEGNTILLGANRLEVEHACSGLRMLVMVAALAVALGVLAGRNWLDRTFLVVCIVPIALIANSVRIVATGIAFQYLSDDASKAISHDVAGWIVPSVAALAMLGALVYWRRLVLETEWAPLRAVRKAEPSRNET